MTRNTWLLIAFVIFVGLATGSIRIEVTTQSKPAVTDQ